MNIKELEKTYFDLEGLIRRLAMMGFDTTSLEKEKESIRLQMKSGG